MLQASFDLELSEIVLTDCRKHKETEEVMTPGSSKDASSVGALRVSEDGIKTFSESATVWFKKNNLTTLVQVKSGLGFDSLPVNLG